MLRFRRFARPLFTERRILKLETDANNLDNRKDPIKHRALYKELFNTGNYKQCISRFETQPQLPIHSSRYPLEQREEDIRKLQSDPVILETYIASMIMDGKSAKVVEKITPLIKGGHIQSPMGLGMQQSSLPPIRETEPTLHNMKTNLSQWQSTIDRTHPNSMFASNNRGLPIQQSEDAPIKVILSEAWSWSKFTRSIASRILIGVLLMTGLSVVLDQQGILKNGNQNIVTL